MTIREIAPTNVYPMISIVVKLLVLPVWWFWEDGVSEEFTGVDSGVRALGKNGGESTGGGTDGTDDGAKPIRLNGFPSFLQNVHQ